jgi:hypothetical protein
MWVVVVFPLVPLITMVLWPADNLSMILGSTLRAIIPGSDRAVLPNRRMALYVALQTPIAKLALADMRFSFNR